MCHRNHSKLQFCHWPSSWTDMCFFYSTLRFCCTADVTAQGQIMDTRQSRNHAVNEVSRKGDNDLGFSSRRGQNQMERPKSRRGATFSKYSIGCMLQPGDQTWNGRAPISNGGRAPLAPSWRRPWLQHYWKIRFIMKSATFNEYYLRMRRWFNIFRAQLMEVQMLAMVHIGIRTLWQPKLFQAANSTIQTLNLCEGNKTYTLTIAWPNERSPHGLVTPLIAALKQWIEKCRKFFCTDVEQQPRSGKALFSVHQNFVCTNWCL